MTIVGRAQIDHPALGTAGGSALHAAIETIYTNIGNDLAGRYETVASVANSAVTTFTHNFGVQFADLKILLYTGTHPNLVRVSDPVAAGWTIAANGGNPKTQVDVTAPGSGGPHTFAVMITHGRGAEKLDELDDVNLSVAAVDGNYFIYDSGSTAFKAAYPYYTSETATITSNTITTTSSKPLQRITGSAADLQMIAAPTAGKLYVFVNETGSSITVKNDTGGTAANRIYTGTGVDFTLKNQGAVTLIYDSGLSRWILAGGAGGGGLTPSPLSGATTAAAGTHYMTNTSGGSFTVTLPAGVAGSVIMVSDANETWDTFPLTIAPASGEKIDNLATNETLVCDVKRGWVELSYNTVLASWSIRSIAATNVVEASETQAGIVSTGAQTFGGAKTFTGLITPTGGLKTPVKFNDNGTKAVSFNMDTTDGADDYRLLISSGGAAGPNRGAYVEMHGNEFSSTPGRILWESGTTASGTNNAWQVNVGASSVGGHGIDGNGSNTFGPSGAGPSVLHQFNGKTKRTILSGNHSSNIGTLTLNGDIYLANITVATVALLGVVDPVEGRIVHIINVGSANGDVRNEDAGATASNRILTGTGSNLGSWLPGGAVTLIYDGGANRWRVISTYRCT